MRILRLLFARERFLLTLVLMLTSVIIAGLVAGRIACTGTTRYAFLIWNLILAWLPLVFALLAHERFEMAGRADGRCAVLAGLWLLFFPNAPYIFTDLVHLTRGSPQLFWVDMMLVLISAMTGLLLGFVSLRLLQSLVTERCGWLTGWAFVAAASGLAALGVHLGRFVRLNSWDAVVAPMTVARQVGSSLQGMLEDRHSAAFVLLFGAFLFLAHAMLHALMKLPQAGKSAKPGSLAASRMRLPIRS